MTARPPSAYVVVSGLEKRYGTTTALDGLSLGVREEEIYGLLGPNGAGKTTLIRILSTVLEPDAGGVRIGGHDLASHGALLRRQIGVVPQELAVYDYLSGEENLRFFGRLYGLRGAQLERRCASTLELVGLRARRLDPVSEYSVGMTRRLNFAMGVLTQPRLLLLDEPLVNVDPQSRDRLIAGIRRLRSAGTSILYTTHDLEDAEQLCDRIGIIDGGRLIAEGTVDELLEHAMRAPAAPGERGPGLRAVFLKLTGHALRD